MVDSREKGARAELKIRDELRELTGLRWERVPASGALDAVHGLKGDLYVPNSNNLFCVECKHYADDQVSSLILTGKNPILMSWWEQAVTQAKKVNKDPLLIFKYDRSKSLVATELTPTHRKHIHIVHGQYDFYILVLTDWINIEEPIFIK